MYESFEKKGQRSKHKASGAQGTDHTPDNMYSTVDLGGTHPNASRRLTSNYGKTAAKRAEYRPDVGIRSSMTGRVTSMAVNGISRYRGL